MPIARRLLSQLGNQQYVVLITLGQVGGSNEGAGEEPPHHRGRRRVLGRLFSVLTHSCETTSTKLPWVSVKVEQRWAQNFSYERFSDNI